MITGDYPFERKTNRRRAALVLAAVALLGAQPGLAAGGAGDTARVTAVRFWSLGDITRVAIEVSSEFSYKSDRLPNPDRLFFDVHGAKPGMVQKGMQTIPVGDGLITQIRIAETTPGVTRVVIDLAQPATFVASQLSNPDRLVVEVRSKDKPAPPPSPSVTGGSKLSSLPAPPSEDLTATAKTAAPALKPIAKTESPEIVTRAKGQVALTAPAATAPAAPATSPATVAAVVSADRTKTEKLPATESKSKRDRRAANSKTSSTPPHESAPAASEPPVATEAAAVTKRAALAELTSRKAAVAPATLPAAPDAAPANNNPSGAGTPANSEVVASASVSDPQARDAGADPLASSARRDNAGRDLVAKLTPPKETPLKESAPAREALPAKRGDRDLTRALGLKLGRVALDAGHGGHDVGTHGPSGYLEKDLSLDITQRLGALIEERLGSEVIYTRQTDTYVGLEERTQIANERKADLFLSIHANSSPYRSAAGVETYVLNFTTSKNALELASRENASAQSSIFNLQELLGKIALREKVDESREFAMRLQTSLSVLSSNSNDGAKNRGVKRAPFVVLIGANMPSVLAEIGFLTNANDEALLRKPEHRQKIAEALYKGIASYASTLSRFQVARN